MVGRVDGIWQESDDIARRTADPLLTSSTLRRIALNRVVSASRFLANNEWPVCAPFNRSLVFVNAIRVAKTFSRGPVPDIIVC